MPEAVPDPGVDLRTYIRDIPDYPTPGILFRDITPLLGDGPAFRSACARLTDRFRAADVGAVASIESRGFTFGAVIAFQLGVGVVPVRKAGRLPAAVISSSYELEYGEAVLEMHQDSIAPGARVLVIDDLLATGGTALATLDLITRLGGVVVGFGFVVELLALEGRARLAAHRVEALLAL
ncbi:MAG TPA: adenine phosphoribosyltransferase [Candidatus Dormibacteraeota bacterium]|nr:adenine phosphoribosyltransferase [Candidatus Dormibacteraeota bacterium]